MQSDTPKRILITFGRSFLSLHIARLLSAFGHRVYVADSVSPHVSQFSNAVTRSFRVPNPRFKPNDYIETLVKIAEKEAIDLIIPIYEEIIHISSHIDRFPKKCTVFCPPLETYEKLQHKWLFQEMLRSLAIPTLKSALITDPKQLTSEALPDEYALKPCFSRASQQVFKVQKGQSIPQIDIASHNPWIAQEWGYGKRFCTYSICHKGKIYAHAVYPVNYAINGHSCISFQAVPHQGILDWISHLVQQIDYSGQIAFDLIEADTGALYPIECNPRATSGVLLFRESDRVHRAFLGQNSTLCCPQMGTTRQIAMGMLMYGWKKSSRQERSLVDFVQTLLGTKDVIFSLRDLKPLIFQPLIFTNLWLKSKKQGISVPDYFTYDHDWNGSH